jgi:signal peptidase I
VTGAAETIGGVERTAGRSPVRAALRLGTATLVSGLLGAALACALLIALPTVTGHRSLTVLTGSMEPTLGVGSIVVDEVIRPTDARVGDIVTFSDPNNRSRLITHRLQSIRVRGATAYMVTRGDANDAPERWSVRTDGEIGRVLLQIPELGHVRALIGSRAGYLLLMIVLLVLGAWVLVDVWRPARQETEEG